LKKIINEPVEGFAVELADESNLFEWKIYIEGPKDTLYEGGVFQLHMKFPADFPMSPPELRFISDFWHPNVYRETGLVCISILHPPVEDEMSGESAAERWMPTQTVATILLSVISLLSSPNFSSPANVDAGVEWRNDPIGYKKKCQRLVEKANREKPPHVVIPHPDTNKEERDKQIEKIKAQNKPIEEDMDFMEDPEGYEEEEGSVSEDEEEEEEEADKDGKQEQKIKSENKDNSSTSSASLDEKKIEKKISSSKSKKSRDSKTNSFERKKFEEDESNSNGPSSSKTGKRRKNKKCLIM